MPTSDTYAKFYIHPSLISAPNDPKEYKDVLFAEICIKGSSNASMGRPKKDSDEIDFAEEWAAYTKNADYIAEGTPLTALPTIGPSAAMNLKSKGISTVEELAELNDNVVIGVSGMLDLRKAALAYMAVAKPEKAEAEKKAMTDQMAKMQSQLETLQQPKTRRKRNEETGQLE